MPSTDRQFPCNRRYDLSAVFSCPVLSGALNLANDPSTEPPPFGRVADGGGIAAAVVRRNGQSEDWNA